MTPEYIQNISQDVIDIYINIETDLLLNIAKKLKLNKLNEDNVADWQVQRLNELGGLTQENIKIIANNSGKTEKEVTALFTKSIDKAMQLDDVTINKAIKAGVMTEINEGLLVKNALNIATNQTLTTFSQVNRAMIVNSGREYTKMINTISAQVLAGTKDINSAVRQSTRNLSDNGITSFTAKNGAKWSTEAYTSMVIKTNVNNTIQEVQDKRIIESGGDYIEINSYVGARPLCSKDQGDIFSLSNNTTPIKDITGKVIRPRAWSSSTHGQPAGIFGINCGHSKFLFVPGISGYERETINAKENSDDYVEKQQQRYLERQIRTAKREKAMLEEAKADTQLIKEAQAIISARQKAMRQFINQTDRTRRPAREFVGV